MVIVWIRSSFVGFHRWRDAPADVAFLRNYHRHVFYAKVGVKVGHMNRDVEFFQLKRRVDSYLAEHFQMQYFEASCEMIAADLLKQFDAVAVEVSEDNENGATVLRTEGEIL